MDMQLARNIVESRAAHMDGSEYLPQTVEALAVVVLKLVKEQDSRRDSVRIAPVDVVHVKPGTYNVRPGVEIRAEDAKNFIPVEPPVVKAQYLEAGSPEYLEAAVWMGEKGHKPYGLYGTANVVSKAYSLGWKGPILKNR